MCPGRLLRANQISFNWDRLVSWINLTEKWPYRTSWIILYLEETDGVPDQATLKSIYERSEVTVTRIGVAVGNLNQNRSNSSRRFVSQGVQEHPDHQGCGAAAGDRRRRPQLRGLPVLTNARPDGPGHSDLPAVYRQPGPQTPRDHRR